MPSFQVAGVAVRILPDRNAAWASSEAEHSVLGVEALRDIDLGGRRYGPLAWVVFASALTH